MLTPISSSLKDTISRNNGLRRHLESLLENKPFTERSWLYDGKYGNSFLEPDMVLKKWRAILEACLKDGNPYSERVWQFDTSQEQKWGPQGGHEPMEDLLSEIVLPSFKLASENRQPVAFTTIEWQKAIEMVIRIYKQCGIHGLHPRSCENVIDTLRVDGKLETNSGWPDFTRRDRPAVRAAAIRAVRNGEWKTYPAIALFRRYNGKTRLVWMFPMSVNLQEARFVQVIMDAIKNSSLIDQFFAPWKGFDQVRKRITEMYDSGRFVAASDFSSADAHFQKAASKEVLKVLTELFHPSCRAELEDSVMHMHEIPLLVGPDKMLVGDHGVASGSNWTNFIETVFDQILGCYATIKLRAVHGLYGQGDDMAWTCSRESLKSVPEWLETIGQEVGQVIKADKTTADDKYVKTLQRLFMPGYRRPDGQLRGVYPTIRALKSSVYPERDHYDWQEDDFCVRQFQILENCVDHPAFAEFVAFICKGNKHLIPFAKRPADYLRAAQRKAKRIPGLVATYNEEKKQQPLDTFESIRIAKEV